MQITVESYGRVIRVTIEGLYIRSESYTNDDPTNSTMHFEKKLPVGHTITQMITNHREPRVIILKKDGYNFTRFTSISLLTGKEFVSNAHMVTYDHAVVTTINERRIYLVSGHN